MKEIAVIGAGPKAAAIAAKAAVLNELAGRPLLKVTVFESYTPMAAWRGKLGYTDGEQPLCTLAERDLGFPYSNATFGHHAASRMLANFSWQAFSLRQRSGRANYEDWVLRGRNPPIHQIFSDYAEDALTRSGATSRWDTTVMEVRHDAVTGRWRLKHRPTAGTATATDAFDGIVVTGSGTPKPMLPLRRKVLHLVPPPVVAAAPTPPLYYDGSSFWTALPRIESALRSAADARVCLIGGGGTAAAIANWCVRRGLKVDLTIIGTSPSLFGRYRGFFEDRLFTDEGEWALLSEKDKREFVARQTAGVVWETILPVLEKAELSYVAGKGVAVEVDPAGELFVEYAPSHNPAALGLLPATVVVDARGFDVWWFLSLLDPLDVPSLGAKDDIERNISHALELQGPSFPTGFHVPMVGFLQGPAAGNLMGLGWMADRILGPYVPPFAAASLGALAAGRP